jgi:hypothetical protein
MPDFFLNHFVMIALDANAHDRILAIPYVDPPKDKNDADMTGIELLHHWLEGSRETLADFLSQVPCRAQCQWQRWVEPRVCGLCFLECTDRPIRCSPETGKNWRILVAPCSSLLTDSLRCAE